MASADFCTGIPPPHGGGSTEVALGTCADLPGYDAPTFTLMPVGYTSRRSVQVSGFTDIGLLTPPCRLVSASCSSGQRFAFGFLQISSRPEHPCRSANSSPRRASRGLSPPSKCALPGAPKKRRTRCVRREEAPRDREGRGMMGERTTSGRRASSAGLHPSTRSRAAACRSGRRAGTATAAGSRSRASTPSSCRCPPASCAG